MSTRYRKGERFRVRATGYAPALHVDRSTLEENEAAVLELLAAEETNRRRLAGLFGLADLSTTGGGGEHEDTMNNQSMKRKLERGEAINVEEILELAAPEAGDLYAGTWRLDRFVEDRDYCVASIERWIWSIGRRLADGAIFAALDSRFYGREGFDCLFLR